MRRAFSCHEPLLNLRRRTRCCGWVRSYRAGQSSLSGWQKIARHNSDSTQPTTDRRRVHGLHRPGAPRWALCMPITYAEKTRHARTLSRYVCSAPRSSCPGFTSLTQMWHGQGSWFNEQSAKGEDKMGWRVEEYVAHTCDAGVHQIEGLAPSKKGARKSKGQKVGKGAPRKVAQKKVAHKKGYAYCSCAPITRKPVSARTAVLQQL